MHTESCLIDLDPDENYFDPLLNQNNPALTSEYISITDFNIICNNVNRFTCLTYNIRSFNRNIDTFLAMFENPRKLPHIMTFTETWFHEGSGRNLPDYRAYHTFRHSARSGGVSVYVNDKIPSKLVEESSFSNNSIEEFTVEIQLNSKKYYIVVIYRRQSGTISTFVSALIELLGILI